MALSSRLFRPSAFYRLSNVHLVFKASSHRKLCSAAQESANLYFRNGFPVLSVPLPSRRENCEFTLLPLSHSVKDLVNNLQEEDGGVERAAVYSLSGTRISGSTGIDILLQSDFKIIVNDQQYTVQVPEEGKLPTDDSRSLSHIKTLVHQIYASMNVEQHQLGKERKLLEQLEEIKLELKPMEELKAKLDKRAAQRTNLMVWGGLGYMALQFGLLARLTWWEYSWDIMEPVTYFVGYGTAIVAYAYFVLTRQEFLYPDARDRQYLISFHKLSKRKSFNISKYNELKKKVSKIEADLKILQSPLHLHLPQKAIQKESADE